MKKQRVLLAMSGGVDSTAAAVLLLQEGYHVDGVMLHLHGEADKSAEADARTAAAHLRARLSAGYPTDNALQALNTLCVLRGRAGAVTVDLAEVHLDTGQAAIYKWGAAPSYLLRRTGAEKIGTATPPPGISVTGCRETVEKLSLCRGEALILVSDGVEVEEARSRIGGIWELPPGELAAELLEPGAGKREDDATVAVIRLCPGAVST